MDQKHSNSNSYGTCPPTRRSTRPTPTGRSSARPNKRRLCDSDAAGAGGGALLHDHRVPRHYRSHAHRPIQHQTTPTLPTPPQVTWEDPKASRNVTHAHAHHLDSDATQHIILLASKKAVPNDVGQKSNTPLISHATYPAKASFRIANPAPQPRPSTHT